MAQSNNPTRLAMAVREQVESRLKDAKKDWEHQWESERKRLTEEIEQLKKAGNIDDKKMRRAVCYCRSLGSFPRKPRSPPKSCSGNSTPPNCGGMGSAVC